jgi:hypothetical protein
MRARLGRLTALVGIGLPTVLAWRAARRGAIPRWIVPAALGGFLALRARRVEAPPPSDAPPS